jgi:cytoskeletal protein CcmA (bactofilin family)
MLWKNRQGKEPGRSDEKEWSSDEGAAPKPAEETILTRTPALRPSLGADTSVTGRLSFTVPTRIDGKLKGEVRATDLLMIGADGFVEGTVRALKLVVQGQVHGDVYAADSVEIEKGGRVLGTIETQHLVVDDGGCLDGDCRIGPPREKVRMLRSAPSV